MERQGKKRISGLFYPLMAALAVLTALFSFGMAFARYQTQEELSFSLLTADKAALQMSLNTTEPWHRNDEGNYGVSFDISNGRNAASCSSETQTVTLELFATVGDLGTAETQEETEAPVPPTEVTLRAAGLSFTATAEPVPEGTVFYREYGPGQIYSFCTGDGEKITWTFPGGQFTQIPMELEVKYGKENTCFMLMAVPSAEN